MDKTKLLNRPHAALREARRGEGSTPTTKAEALLEMRALIVEGSLSEAKRLQLNAGLQREDALPTVFDAVITLLGKGEGLKLRDIQAAIDAWSYKGFYLGAYQESVSPRARVRFDELALNAVRVAIEKEDTKIASDARTTFLVSMKKVNQTLDSFLEAKLRNGKTFSLTALYRDFEKTRKTVIPIILRSIDYHMSEAARLEREKDSRGAEGSRKMAKRIWSHFGVKNSEWGNYKNSEKQLSLPL